METFAVWRGSRMSSQSSLGEAFSLWGELIESREQVVLGIPFSMSESKGTLVNESKYEES